MTETREYVSHETYGPFEAGASRTTFGRWMLTPTSATHIHIDANHNSGTDLGSPEGLRITVRGVPYGVSGHLYRESDGSWREGTGEDRYLYMSRLDRYNGPRDLHASQAAVDAACRLVYPLVAAWAESPEGREALAKAEQADANNALYRIEADMRKAQAELTELRKAHKAESKRLV